jgi:phage repressor protein C with HTH and peptisase S24 domain
LDKQNNASTDQESTERLKTIPYFPEINASAGLDFLTDNSVNHSIPMCIPNVDVQAFINVFGDSMDPIYCSGEIIGIKEIMKDFVMYGYAYVVHMADGEAYLKYIKKGKDSEHWILASENPRYEPKEFHLSSIDKVFIIKAVISKTTIL